MGKCPVYVSPFETHVLNNFIYENLILYHMIFLDVICYTLLQTFDHVNSVPRVFVGILTARTCGMSHHQLSNHYHRITLRARSRVSVRGRDS